MKYTLYFIDLLMFQFEDCNKPWSTSTNLTELIATAKELRSCANENHDRIQGYWAQIWIEPEYGDIITF